MYKDECLGFISFFGKETEFNDESARIAFWVFFFFWKTLKITYGPQNAYNHWVFWLEQVTASKSSFVSKNDEHYVCMCVLKGFKLHACKISLRSPLI